VAEIKAIVVTDEMLRAGADELRKIFPEEADFILPSEEVVERVLRSIFANHIQDQSLQLAADRT
jgi:hypothetical protein